MGSTALITVGNTKITKENVYTGLKTQGAVNSIINMVTQIICDNEIPLTDEIKAEAQSTMDSFKGYVGEENWDAFIKGNGYASEEDYFKSACGISCPRRSSSLRNILKKIGQCDFCL